MKDKGIVLQLDDSVRDKIIAVVETLHYGARPLQRKLQKLIEDKVALMLLDGKKRKTITVTLVNDKIVLR